MGFHQRVDEAPADRRVEDIRLAGESLRGLAHHEGRARHAFDTAGDDQIGITTPNRPRGEADSLQTGAAEAIDRHTRNRRRQTREQQRHPRDIAIILAGLIGPAEDNVIDAIPVDPGVTILQHPQTMSAEIVRPDILEHAAVAAERAPGEIADIGVPHGLFPRESLSLAACLTPRRTGQNG